MALEIEGVPVRGNVALKSFTTLKVGGPAELFAVANTADELAALAQFSQERGKPFTVVGGGSNLLPSDRGVAGLTILNRSARIDLYGDEIVADAGAPFQEVFLKAAQAGLNGLQFAVGIPGSLGGALVSNAGAYRSNISALVIEIEIVENGKRQWVPADWMKFEYRNSILRKPGAPKVAMIRVRMKLVPGDRKKIYDDAREWQRQRIRKQPPMASAGSFFKNVEDPAFALTVVGLPDALREAGVVPAGYLIEGTGLKGHRLGGAMLGKRHANFILNTGGATAWEIWSLAQYAKTMVQAKYGVELEEEVLRIGNW